MELIMTIIKQTKLKKREIDLSGPDGNAYALLTYAKDLATQCDLDFDKIKDEMMKGDYENLLEAFDSYFGDVIDLVRE